MTITIIQGHVIDKLKELPEKSVHTVITSPPYFGLRDYGMENQIGLEDTPEEYVDKIVEVFCEVRRVLRDDGTVWLVIGDSYWGGKGSNANLDTTIDKRIAEGRTMQRPQTRISGLKVLPTNRKHEIIKAKDLVGIPWRVAFALQIDGWYLRSDTIWSKPNPMPESVEDRPVKSHEYVFLLSKQRFYYYDAMAVREKAAYDGRQDTMMKGSEKYMNGYAPTDNPQTCAMVGHERWPYVLADGSPSRSRRDVWHIPTQSTPEAHFATFPEALVLPCIRAGTSDVGVCPDCGAPWKRILKREKAERVERTDNPNLGGLMRCPEQMDRVTTLGWEAACKCGKVYTVPATVLDPFGGSGTTGKVARELNRHCILIELNPDYIKIMRKKLRLNEQLMV